MEWISYILDSEDIALTPLPEDFLVYSEVTAAAYHGDAPAKPVSYQFWYICGAGALLLAGGAVLGILLRRKRRKQMQHLAE